MDRPEYELSRLLAASFRLLTDELQQELADRGHFELRPVHTFALQAISSKGATTVDVARRLDVSKQAAGKTVATLERLRYVTRSPMPGDGRASLISLTPWGLRALNDSAEVLAQLRQKWVAKLGLERVEGVEAALKEIVGDAGGDRLDDVPG